MADTGDGKRIAWTADLVFPGLAPNKHLHAVIDMPPRAAILARDGTILAHGRQPRVQGPRRVGADPRHDGADPGRPARRLRGARHPGDDDRRHQRARADLRPPPDRATRAERCWPEPRSWPTPSAHRGHPVRTTISIPRAARGDRGARRPARRRRRDQAEDGRDRRLRRDRVLGPTAAGLDVQDHHHDRRAGEPRRQDDDHVPVLVLRDARAASSSTTRAARTAAGRWRSRSPSRATRCSRRSVPRSGRRSSSTWRSGSASTRRPASWRPPSRRSRPPRTIGDDLAVGSSAIGQGRVQATTLQMALVAATIALKGKRPAPTLVWHARPKAGQDDEGDDAAHRADRQAADDRRRARGDRHAGGDPRRHRGGQDRHRGARVDRSVPAG